MSGQIFISYRREESRWSAGRLFDRLTARFDRRQIFMDIDGIGLGEDFVETIEKKVGACDVLIAVIGAHWLTSSDQKGGRRLDNPEDFVRMEIGTALRRNIRVIPVLVDGALMPKSTDLPDDLKRLARRNALLIGDTHFDDDCRRLVAAIEEVVERTEAGRKQREEAERLESERLETEEKNRPEIGSRQKEEQDWLAREIREPERGKRIATELRAREEKERLKDESRAQPPSIAPSIPSDKSKADEPPGETMKVYPLGPKPVESEGKPPSNGAAGKSPLKQLIAFLAIAAFLVVCGVLVYLNIRAPNAASHQILGEKVSPRSETTDQQRKHKTTPFAVETTPVPSISATPTKEELVRTALDNATKDHPWVNSLGMKFVPVPRTPVLFSVWDTRVQDFETFAKGMGYDATGEMWSIGKDGWTRSAATWKEAGFSQGANHPVVGVSWKEAKEFCKWLTRRECIFGDLPEDREYRLPTDEEWSMAAGLKNELGVTPEGKSCKIALYPWDIPKKREKSWPPPAGVGNYAGEEVKNADWPHSWSVIEGYNDGYARTSPVGSFEANFNGLHDMGGNVWQWCEDWFNSQAQYRVLRGASWTTFDSDSLLASCRLGNAPDGRRDDVGFRCVVAAVTSK
jgi:formylglycine-generating enzyme required for sulfatase activity